MASGAVEEAQIVAELSRAVPQFNVASDLCESLHHASPCEHQEVRSSFQVDGSNVSIRAPTAHML
jgi:hypothetical protein